MNEYLKAFQDITQSIEQVLNEQHHSSEIKKSARSLRASVEPCFKELKQSATRLETFVQKSLSDLDLAEDIWHSKPRIAAAATQEIWEQLGELSGLHSRIQQLGNQGKDEAIKQAKKYWEEQIYLLHQRWFIDAKGQVKKGVSWGEKDGFIKDIQSEINYRFPLPKLTTIIGDSLKPVCLEINGVNVELIRKFINTMNKRSQYNIHKNLGLKFSNIQQKYSDEHKHSDSIIKVNKYNINKSSITTDLDALTGASWGDIYWEQVVNFKEKVWSKTEQIIKSIFQAEVKIATEAIDEAIAFYNNFLELQNRYQQETPEQREAEKAWIDQQRQQLNQVQQGIKEILNQSAG